jgi:hypothetical protein
MCVDRDTKKEKEVKQCPYEMQCYMRKEETEGKTNE